jgi:hypothetical protein
MRYDCRAMEKPGTHSDVELIPPQKFGRESGGHEPLDPLAKDPVLVAVAKFMDSAFVIPGTGIRIGLDPIVGLIPVAGDLISAAVSAFVVYRCGRLGMPRVVLARMCMNVVANTLVGAIPGVGDAFSVWFRSNEKNLDLARAYLGNPRRSTRHDWLWVAGALLAVAGTVALFIWMLAAVFGAIGRLFGLS